MTYSVWTRALVSERHRMAKTGKMKEVAVMAEREYRGGIERCDMAEAYAAIMKARYGGDWWVRHDGGELVSNPGEVERERHAVNGPAGMGIEPAQADRG